MNTEESSPPSTVDNESSEIISAVSFSAFDIPQKEKLVRLMSFNAYESSEESERLLDTCPFFWDIPRFAKKFVEDIIEEAEGVVNKHGSKMYRPIDSSERLLIKRRSEDYPVVAQARPKFTGWPTVSEYTIGLGADKIDEYLSSFSTDEDWLYIIYYLGLKNDKTSKFYEYQAIWSLPSPEYPIPQATASVFFTIEVSEVVPPNCLVNVTFNFEGHQFKHQPGLTDFSEEFLNFILDSKIGVFKEVRF